MRRGGGKSKGSHYERDVCRKLSLWVSAGQSVDCFWRSAMSGGRSTVQARKGVVVRQSGDITAVSPEGHALTDRFLIECKFYRDLGLSAFLLTGKGNLSQFWATASTEAALRNKQPLLIAKQNRFPELVVCHTGALTLPNNVAATRVCRDGVSCDVLLLSDMLATNFEQTVS